MSNEAVDYKEAEATAMAAQAKALIENPLLRKIIEAEKESCFEAWGDPSNSLEAREELWRHYRATVRFEEIVLTACSAKDMYDKNNPKEDNKKE